MGQFGDIDKFQYRKALEVRLRNALMRAYKNARDKPYQHAILAFRENMRANEEIDNGRIPAGNYVHPIHQSHSKSPDKSWCYLVFLRCAILIWWSYQLGKDDITDKIMDEVIKTLEEKVDAYPNLFVAGDVKAGYRLTKHKPTEPEDRE